MAFVTARTCGFLAAMTNASRHGSGMIARMNPSDAGILSLSRTQKRIRLVALGVLLLGIVVTMWFVSFTDTGRQIFDNRQAVQAQARRWVDAQPLLAATVYILIYLVCGLLLLPIWWLQIIAGFAFGLAWGCIYTLAAAALTATVTMLFSRWLAGAWFREKIESRMERVRRLEELMGHNGLLVVMAVRLMYFLPFGISNYLFGLTRIRPVEVFLGSMLGGFPALTIYVTSGADYTLFATWRYWMILGTINLVLVMPLVLRYLWPRWFRKMGVE